MSAFVYGTLMFPEVLQALINRVPRMEPAAIQGFQRYRIKGQVAQPWRGNPPRLTNLHTLTYPR
jgi:hypothetical protein